MPYFNAVLSLLPGHIRLFTDAELRLLGQVFSSSKPSSSPPGEDTVNTTPSRDNYIGLLQSNFSDRDQSPIGGVDGPTSVYQRLRKMLSTNSWARDPVLKAYLEKPLTRLCAYYLYKEKRRGYALNSVGEKSVGSCVATTSIQDLCTRICICVVLIYRSCLSENDEVCVRAK